MSREELLQRFPNASDAFLRANLSADNPRTDTKLERDFGDAPLETEKVQRQAGGRFLIRVTSVRKRLLDESNLCYKFHEDLCRYAGMLPSDAPDKCHSEVRQFKAVKGEPEHTLIEVWAATI